MDPTQRPDPLADLRERLRATQEAAARLSGDPPRVPPQGWATSSGAGRGDDELAALVALVAALRDLVPADLQQQVADLVRQILVLLRTLIDLWIERLDADRGAEPEVEEIPIA